MHSSKSSIILLSAAVGLLTTTMATASAPFQEEPTTQACNDGMQTYTAPGGSAEGTGVSKSRAKKAAGRSAVEEVLLSVTPCDICPDEVEVECDGARNYDWEPGGQVTAVFDIATGYWVATNSWDSCTIQQWCTACD